MPLSRLPLRLPVPEASGVRRLCTDPLLAAVSAGYWHLGVTGTGAMVADTMQQWFEEGACDGFIVQPPYLPGGAERAPHRALVIYEARCRRADLGWEAFR